MQFPAFMQETIQNVHSFTGDLQRLLQGLYFIRLGTSEFLCMILSLATSSMDEWHTHLQVVISTFGQ